jgi:hypothetical protein
MKLEIFLSVFMAIALIVINVFLYRFVIDMYIVEHTEVFHERPSFAGFFHGRAAYWYVVINAPLITAVLLLVRVARRYRKLKKAGPISR